MSKTIAELIKETESNCTFKDFPIGQRAEVVVPCEDFTFFWNEKGTIIKNTGEYLGITLKFDEVRHYEDGSTIETFNFNPKSLKPIGEIKPKVDIPDKVDYKEVAESFTEFLKEKGYKIYK